MNIITSLPHMTVCTFRRTLGRLFLGLLFGVLLSACDTTSNVAQDTSSTEPAAQLSGIGDDLSDAIDLTEEQSEAIQALLDQYREQEAEPGTLWHVAADLHGQLTSEQVDQLQATLAARREARTASRAPRGPRRGMHGPRSGMQNGEGPRAEWLNLTDEQKAAMQAIRETYRDQLQALREKRRDGTFDESDAEQLASIREEMRSEMQAVLTDEQRAQIEARREQMEARRKANRAAMAEALELTDEQQAALEAWRTQRSEQGRPPRGIMRRGTGGDARDALSSILTEEQMEIALLHRVLQRRVLQQHRRGPIRRG